MSYVTADGLRRYILEAEKQGELIRAAIGECEAGRHTNLIEQLANENTKLLSVLSDFQNALDDIEDAEVKVKFAKQYFAICKDNWKHYTNSLTTLSICQICRPGISS